MLTRHSKPAIVCLGKIFDKYVKNKNNDTENASGRPNSMDILFGCVLMGVVAFVAWVGYLAYEEGLKIETSKRHGEAWLQWLGEASASRYQPGFEPAGCAGPRTAVRELPLPAPVPGTVAVVAAVNPVDHVNTWGTCFSALTRSQGPWEGQINPFSGKPVSLVAKCDKSDLTVAGNFVVEKLTPTPPGSPVPAVASLLTEADLLDVKTQIRLTLCDKGGDPIRIGEVEF